MDEDARVMWVGRSFTQLTGYNEREVIGVKFLDLLDRRFNDSFLEARIEKSVKASEGFDVQVWFLHRQGESFLAQVTADPFTSEPNGASKFSVAITAVSAPDEVDSLLALTRNTHSGVGARERDLVKAQAVSKMGSWHWVIENDQVSWSPEMYRIYGIDPALGPSSYRSHPQLFTRESWSLLDHAVEEALQFGTSYELELDFFRTDGSQGRGIAMGEAIRDENGTIVELCGTMQDVTERCEAEKTARELESRFMLATELTNTGLFDWEINSEKVQYSKVWKQQLGYEEHEISDDVREWRDRLHPEDVSLAMGRLERYFTDPSVNYDIEFRLLHKDGEYRWMLSKAGIVFDEAGKPIRIIGCHIDITERKRTEQAFKDSQLRMQALFDHAQNAMVIATTDGRFLEVNPAACSLLGYDREELLQLGLFNALYDDQSIYSPQDDWEQFIEAGQGSGTAELVHKNGSIVLADYSAVANILPGIHLAVLSDVTQKRATESALHLARFTLDHATMPVFWIKPDGSFMDFNEVACRVLGYTREEMAALNVHDIDPAFSSAVWPEEWKQLHDTGVAVFHSAHRRKDGSFFEVEITVHHLKFERLDLMCAFVRDVTEIQKTAREKQTLELQLREAQKMEAIGTLAGGIAHDFNNILGAIIGNTELAREDVGHNAAAELSLNEINKAAIRAKSLVQQILTFSRRQPQSFTLLDLGPLVAESIGMLRAVLPSGIEISSELGHKPIHAKVDATQINQILMNLCTNAWQAMPDGKGYIKIELTQVELGSHSQCKLKELKPGSYARLSVADNGLGIPQEVLDRIFEPFFTTKPIGEGTGLGLAVVHGIVKEHLGAILVRSRQPIGTTFDVYLPLAASPESANTALGSAGSGTIGSGRHILYVDDEESMVLMIRRSLERRGFRVTGFLHADQAIEAFIKNPDSFDLVVTDQNMPGASGLDVTRMIRSVRPEMPIAIVSGYLSDELIGRANELGVTELVYKPNTVQELCESITNLIG